MKKKFVMVAIVVTLILPVHAFSAQGYFAVWSTATTKRVESGPYPDLAACQEFLAKMLGNFNDMRNAMCIKK
jgi:hypothetical protein